MKKSKALTFFLSFVPGLGHYYLGLMNRGLQFMVGFFGFIFLMNFLNLNSFPFLLPIIWFYSLFDALQKYQILAETNNVKDEPLFSMEQWKPNKLWIGWGLIIIGGYSLFDQITMRFGWQYQYMLKNSLVAVILIILGWYLISGRSFPFHRKSKEER